MTQANDNNMDSSSRLEQQKDWDKDEEIRVTGLCIRIKNFLNLGRRLRKVSPGKFCWRQEKNKSSLSPTRTSTTAASHDSNTTASTTGAATITTVSMDRRRKELQCEIEGDEKSFPCSFYFLFFVYLSLIMSFLLFFFFILFLSIFLYLRVRVS